MSFLSTTAQTNERYIRKLKADLTAQTDRACLAENRLVAVTQELEALRRHHLHVAIMAVVFLFAFLIALAFACRGYQWAL